MPKLTILNSVLRKNSEFIQKIGQRFLTVPKRGRPKVPNAAYIPYKKVIAGVSITISGLYYIDTHRVHALDLFSFFGKSKINPDGFLDTPITDLDKLKKNGSDMRAKMELLCMDIQAKVVKELEKFEAEKKFLVDKWLRDIGGGGITCILEDGAVFERAGVNVSVVHGKLPKSAIQQMRARGKTFNSEDELPFFACGVSSVIHPRNPNIPTLHFNYRYFEVVENDGTIHWWFGGGTDMTPYILFENDAVHFHKTLKNTCDRHDKEFYPKFKKWCDDYFVITHRGESRGIGGIFFDDLEGSSRESTYNFLEGCANSVIPCYIPIVQRNKDKGYDYSDRQWQLLRRGRYVEFNLVYDRGTKFGLATPSARIESILMSLPQTANWKYCHIPEENSKEHKLLEVLKNPIDWASKG